MLAPDAIETSLVLHRHPEVVGLLFGGEATLSVFDSVGISPSCLP